MLRQLWHSCHSTINKNMSDADISSNGAVYLSIHMSKYNKDRARDIARDVYDS